ncbi:MAG: UbiX family flavin prenyltransferase [Pseudomonadota bacterium]
MRLIVGITGASGVIYGERLLRALRELDVETHLVLTRSARLTIEYELDVSFDEIADLAAKVHPLADVGASLASGSFKTKGMIIAPCSMHTLGSIANGIADNLLTRAADVTLKERRRLVLMVRETPLHLGHLRNMVKVTEMGGIIAPPVPGFYARPKSIEELVDHTLGRVLDLFDLETGRAHRWRDDNAVVD